MSNEFLLTNVHVQARAPIVCSAPQIWHQLRDARLSGIRRKNEYDHIKNTAHLKPC
jgi:hypothetical protein